MKSEFLILHDDCFIMAKIWVVAAVQTAEKNNKTQKSNGPGQG
jgi:hypothetical protein